MFRSNYYIHLAIHYRIIGCTLSVPIGQSPRSATLHDKGKTNLTLPELCRTAPVDAAEGWTAHNGRNEVNGIV